MGIKINSIIINKKASKNFEKTIRNDLERLPENIKKSLKNHNKKYILTQVMSDIAPWTKGVTPRGWPAGLTWDDCEAASNKKKAILCEKAFKRSHSSIKGAIYHETGHLTDRIFETVTGKAFCETKGFKEVYKKDVTHIYQQFSQNDKLNLPDEGLDYYIQGSTPSKTTSAGLQETFAEVFTLLNNASNSNSKSYNKFILKNFKHTVDYVDKFMYLFGGKKQ